MQYSDPIFRVMIQVTNKSLTLLLTEIFEDSTLISFYTLIPTFLLLYWTVEDKSFSHRATSRTWR